MFLVQYWGGPRTYSEQRGHPRLRMRHVTFRIGPRERDAWLARMRASMDELPLSAEQDAMLWDYLVMAAQSLVNVPSDPAEDPLKALGLVLVRQALHAVEDLDPKEPGTVKVSAAPKPDRSAWRQRCEIFEMRAGISLLGVLVSCLGDPERSKRCGICSRW